MQFGEKMEVKLTHLKFKLKISACYSSKFSPVGTFSSYFSLFLKSFFMKTIVVSNTWANR